MMYSLLFQKLLLAASFITALYYKFLLFFPLWVPIDWFFGRLVGRLLNTSVGKSRFWETQIKDKSWQVEILLFAVCYKGFILVKGNFIRTSVKLEGSFQFYGTEQPSPSYECFKWRHKRWAYQIWCLHKAKRAGEHIWCQNESSKWFGQPILTKHLPYASSPDGHTMGNNTDLVSILRQTLIKYLEN